MVGISGLCVVISLFEPGMGSICAFTLLIGADSLMITGEMGPEVGPSEEGTSDNGGGSIFSLTATVSVLIVSVYMCAYVIQKVN